MVFDFSFVLVALAAVTGVIWGLDHWLFEDKRRARGAAKDPVLVDYARSFFPVILIVLVLRSFLYEPFRIPSDSMMPTLVHGDFIFVNKWRYGLRLPVANTKVVGIGLPQRGDVVVFRKPTDPSLVLIKRLVGHAGRQDPRHRDPGLDKRYAVTDRGRRVVHRPQERAVSFHAGRGGAPG